MSDKLEVLTLELKKAVEEDSEARQKLIFIQGELSNCSQWRARAKYNLRVALKKLNIELLASHTATEDDARRLYDSIDRREE
jgi:hypothetical protein